MKFHTDMNSNVEVTMSTVERLDRPTSYLRRAITLIGLAKEELESLNSLANINDSLSYHINRQIEDLDSVIAGLVVVQDADKAKAAEEDDNAEVQ